MSASDEGGVRKALVEAVPNLRAFGISLCGDVDRAVHLRLQTPACVSEFDTHRNRPCCRVQLIAEPGDVFFACQLRR